MESFFERILTVMTQAKFKAQYKSGLESGYGASGVVYKAVQLQTGISVAIKILRRSVVFSEDPDQALSPDVVYAEIVIHASLHHPNIAEFHDALIDENNTEYIHSDGALQWLYSAKSLDGGSARTTDSVR